MTIECPKCQHENPAGTAFCGKCGTKFDSDIGPTKTVETPKEELKRGSVFANRYEIIEELGKGGMGRVYRVEDTKIKKEIALKLIKPEIASDKKTIERFKNELTTAREIVHRNVCRMFDLSEEKGQHYITMEYVPGQDLKGLIRQSAPMSATRTISIAKQICAGLAEAHSLGVIHRDLKPSNIMIDKQGNARIMDFGIARSLKAKSITKPGLMIGTPEYMSPEQAEAKDIDQRSDIYSLGIILFEMATGQLPFQGETSLAIAMKHKGEAPKDPRELNPRLPEDLSRVILNCLNKDKDLRYRNAGDLLSELERLEQGLPTTEKGIPGKKTTTSKEITVTFSLKKFLIPAAAVVILAILTGLVFLRPSKNIDPDKILVAAFQNQTGEEDLADIGSYVAHGILQELSQIEEIELVPFQAVMQSSLSPTGEKKLAEELGAGIIVSGVYYLIDDNLTFRVSITETRRGRLIRELDPVSGFEENKQEIIEDLYSRVVGCLAMYVDPNFGRGNAAISKQPRYEAFQEYILGREAFGLYDYERSRIHFQRAIDLDPDFLSPRIAMAVSYGNQGDLTKQDSMFHRINEQRDRLSQYDRHYLDFFIEEYDGRRDVALSHLRQAESLNPNGIDINFLRGQRALLRNYPWETIEVRKKIDPEDYPDFFRTGWGSTWFGHLISAHHRLGNFKQALKEIARAREYYPSRLNFFEDKAKALAALGRVDRVKEVIEDSLLITSSSGYQGEIMLEASRELRIHGFTEVAQELAEQAVAWYEEFYPEDEENEVQINRLALALYEAGHLDESMSLFKRLSTGNPEDIEYLGYLGVIAARKGDSDEARSISKKLQNIEIPYIYGSHTFWRACIAANLNEKESAVRLLRDAFSQGQWYADSLYNSVTFEPLRDYKPFQELIKPKR